MKLTYHPLSLLLVAMVWATACTPEEIDSAALVQERFLERVAQLRQNLERDCQEDVLETAIQRADSLLIDRARRMRRIEGRPPRPPRPGSRPSRN